jgi:hypothetical protein
MPIRRAFLVGRLVWAIWAIRMLYGYMNVLSVMYVVKISEKNRKNIDTRPSMAISGKGG